MTGRGRSNLALGKTYTMNPQPNYRHTTDPQDNTQLTDGAALGCDWLRPSTVGWNRVRQPVRVEIDLGRVEPIAGVRVYTIGGGKANVLFPANLLLLVSDDRKEYRAAAAADSLSLPQNRYDPIISERKPFRVEMGPLHTRGRYVLLVLEMDGDYMFLDEIEVMAGQHDRDSVEFADGNRFTRDQALALVPLARSRSYLRLALEKLAGGVRAHADPQWIAECRELENRFAALPVHDGDAVRRLSQSVDRLRGRWLHHITGRRIHWSVANPMNWMFATDLPAGLSAQNAHTSIPAGFELSLWQGEYESAAVNVFNCTDNDVWVVPRITPLRRANGGTIPADHTMTMRWGHPVASRGIGPNADALVRAAPAGVLLPAGRARQLWLTVHDPDLKPGVYPFAVDVSHHDPVTRTEQGHQLIQGRITVQPLRFPDNVALKTTTWAYLEKSEPIAHARREAMSDLLGHYSNVFPLFWSRSLPMPALGADGSVRVPFDRFDAALKRYAGAKQFLFFWGVGKKRQAVPHLPPISTPEGKRALRDWITKWVAHMRERGMSYDDYYMYPCDEDIGDACFEMIRFLKTEVDPNLPFFANHRGDKAGRQLTRLAPYVDVWSFRDVTPGRRIGAVEQRIRKSGAEIWCYDCGRPAKGKPPYGYYRLQMWRAFARGDVGCGFWVYADPDGDDAWDDFRSHDGRYSAVYSDVGAPAALELSGERIIPSRRWEAWREGIEDYEYLHTLQQAIQEAPRDGRAAEAARARAVLADTIDQVLSHPSDPDVVYRARESITREILSLRETNRPRAGAR